MFRHIYGHKMEQAVAQGDISEVTKAAVEAIHAGCPFHHVQRVLKNAGFVVEGTASAFTVKPLFDGFDLGEEVV